MTNDALILALLLPPFLAALGVAVLALRRASGGPSYRAGQIGAVATAAALLCSTSAAVRGLIDLRFVPPVGDAGIPLIRADFGVWFAVDALVARAHFVLDPLACTFAFIAAAVGFALCLTEIGGLGRDAADPGKRLGTLCRLNLSIGAAMVAFVAADVPLLLAGWLLAAFVAWTTVARRAPHAGQRVIVYDRIGDGAFVLGAIALAVAGGTVDLDTLARLKPALAPLAWILLAGGIATKLGGLPLHPRAIAALRGGPIGSALVTMTAVAIAGYAAVRLAPILSPGGWRTIALALLGAASAITANAFAAVARDGRDAVAHLIAGVGGLALVAVAVGASSDVAMMTIMLGLAGTALILAEDMISTRHDDRSRPTAAMVALVATAAALAGLPLTAGHLVYGNLTAAAFHAASETPWLRAAAIAVFVAVLIGAVAMARLVWSTGRTDGAIRHRAGASLPNALTLAPVLALMAAGVSIALVDLPAAFAPVEPRRLAHFFGASIQDRVQFATNDAVWVAYIAVGATVIAGVLLFVFALARRPAGFRSSLEGRSLLGRVHALLLGRGYVEGAYERHVGRSVRRSAGVTSVFDDFIIEGFLTGGVFGVLARVTGEGLRLLQSGRVQGYVLAAFAGGAIIVLCLLADLWFGGTGAGAN